MAAVNQVYQFTATIPAGTAPSSPYVLEMPMPTLEVAWVEWEVPPGARGNVGFWIGSKGQQIIPFASTTPNWIVTDGRSAHWDMGGLPDSGSWELQGYNNGVNAHSVTVRFGLAAQPTVPVVTPLPADALSTL